MAKFYFCRVYRQLDESPLVDGVTPSSLSVLCSLDFPHLFSRSYRVELWDEFYPLDRNQSLRYRRLSRRIVAHITQFDKLPFTKRL